MASKISVYETGKDDLDFLLLKVNTNIPYSDKMAEKIATLIENIVVEETPKRWTKEWPKEPGTSWFFYGWTSTMGKRDDKPEYHIVHIWKTGNGVTYVCDGHFLYQQEGAEGIFFKIDYPPIPDQT
jgi:hypothetical protein